MANNYYSPTSIVAQTKARSSQENSDRTAVETAFDRLPTRASMDAGSVWFVSDTGAADVYAVAMQKTATSYTDGMSFTMKVANTNTGACTVNVDGLGAKAVKSATGADPVAGDLTDGDFHTLVYDADAGYFRIVSMVRSVIAGQASMSDQDIKAAYERVQGFEAIADGAITAGEFVALQSDGTVAAVDATGTAASVGTPSTVASSTTVAGHAQMEVVADQGDLLLYGFIASDDNCYSAEISGASATWTAKTDYAGATLYNFQHLAGGSGQGDSGYVVATYVTGAFQTGDLYAVCSSWNGAGTLSHGTPVVVKNNAATGYIQTGSRIIYDVSADAYVSVGYSTGSNNEYLRYHVMTRSGTAVTVGTEGTVSSGAYNSGSSLALGYDPDDARVVMFTKESGGTAMVGCAGVTTGGTTRTVAWNSSFTSIAANSYTPSEFLCSYNTSDNKWLVVYRINNSGAGQYEIKGVVVTLSGGALSGGTLTNLVVTSDLVTPTGLVYDVVLDQWVMTYSNTTDTDSHHVLPITLSGSVPVPQTAAEFRAGPVLAGAAVYEPVSQQVFAITGDNASADVQSVTLTGPAASTNALDWIGVSRTTVSDGQTAYVQTQGMVDENQSSLAAKTKYYLDYDGSLTTNETVFGEVGRAVAATKLFITKTGSPNS